ncbi:MAG TPA: hypothetical protein VFS21_36500 [Roseiflexaceae bacterium]|nr:hypothetical protein [Roseiflexaceae bacterium]
MWPFLLMIAFLGLALTFRGLLTLICNVGFALLHAEAPFAADRSFAQGALGVLLLALLLWWQAGGL